jgi:hypothetical protein
MIRSLRRSNGPTVCYSGLELSRSGRWPSGTIFPANPGRWLGLGKPLGLRPVFGLLSNNEELRPRL